MKNEKKVSVGQGEGLEREKEWNLSKQDFTIPIIGFKTLCGKIATCSTEE